MKRRKPTADEAVMLEVLRTALWKRCTVAEAAADVLVDCRAGMRSHRRWARKSPLARENAEAAIRRLKTRSRRIRSLVKRFKSWQLPAAEGTLGT